MAPMLIGIAKPALLSPQAQAIKDSVDKNGGFLQLVEKEENKPFPSTEFPPETQPPKTFNEDRDLNVVDKTDLILHKRLTALKGFSAQKGELKQLNEYLRIHKRYLLLFILESLCGSLTEPNPALIQDFIDKIKKTRPDLIITLLKDLLPDIDAEKTPGNSATAVGQTFAPIIINNNLLGQDKKPNHLILESE